MRKAVFLAILAVILTGGLASAAYQVGDSIADFTLTDTDGNPVSLYDYNGKVIFLNFWTST